MNNNETTNPTLSFEQLQAIDEAKKRLTNIENEIVIGNRNFKVLKNDTERVTKENLYQNELLSNVIAQVSEKQARATVLDEQLLAKSDELSKLNSEIATKSALQTAKDMEFKDREDKIVLQENQIEEKEQKLAEKNQTFKQQIEAHNEKVAKLREVTALF